MNVFTKLLGLFTRSPDQQCSNCSQTSYSGHISEPVKSFVDTVIADRKRFRLIRGLHLSHTVVHVYTLIDRSTGERFTMRHFSISYDTNPDILTDDEKKYVFDTLRLFFCNDTAERNRLRNKRIRDRLMVTYCGDTK